MIFRWMIEFLNFSFVFSLGMVTLWLFFQSLTFDRVRRSSPKQRAELLLEVYRDGAPYLKIPFNKGHYLIGRGPECDIPLRGMGIPLKIGEMYEQEGNYVFKNLHNNSVMINGRPLGKEIKSVSPGDEINAYNYSIQIKEKVPLTPTLSPRTESSTRQGRGG
jgi:hypothetical protein